MSQLPTSKVSFVLCFKKSKVIDVLVQKNDLEEEKQEDKDKDKEEQTMRMWPCKTPRLPKSKRQSH